jgi:antitoxin component YwqK of YwqJK toxin-antitoxin module
MSSIDNITTIISDYNKLDTQTKQDIINANRVKFMSINNTTRIIDGDIVTYIKELCNQLNIMSNDPIIFKFCIMFYISILDYKLRELTLQFSDIFSYTHNILSSIIVNNNFNINFIKILQNEDLVYNGDDVDNDNIKIYKNLRNTIEVPHTVIVDNKVVSTTMYTQNNIVNKYVEYYKNGNVKLLSYIDHRKQLVYKQFFENIAQINNTIIMNKTTLVGTIHTYDESPSIILSLINDLYNHTFIMTVYSNKQKIIELSLNLATIKSVLNIYNLSQ